MRGQDPASKPDDMSDTAAMSPPAADVHTSAASQPAAKSKIPLVIGALAVVVIGAVSYWFYERQFEDTDDAQIDATISNVSPRVAGTIKSVFVLDNQRVKVGDPLAEIDDADLQVAVALARAQVAQAEAQLEVEDPTVPITETSNKTLLTSTSSDLASAQAAVSMAKKQTDELTAQIAQAQANDKNAQIEKRRADELIAQGAITQSEHDQRTSAAEASAANVQALRQAYEAAREGVAEKQATMSATVSRVSEAKLNAPRQVEARRASVVWRQASLDAAKAQLSQAELNLGYAKILAPVAGIVGKKSIAVGDHVAPGQELMAISQIDRVWVTANFRETQLAKIHPGLGATVHVDAIEADLHGTIESIGGATGSRYSVLPPENASGNYVKVVQRVPVRIALDPGQPGIDLLRPGMSVEPKVKLQ
jgi:membrane fusion protein (multidrug efflux system)